MSVSLESIKKGVAMMFIILRQENQKAVVLWQTYIRSNNRVKADYIFISKSMPLAPENNTQDA